MSWDPAQYGLFADARARPAIDLIARLPDAPAPRRITDLGCGDGRITRLLQARWPGAAVTGIDSDAAMLAAAREPPGDIEWVAADIAGWRPDTPRDLIFSNAGLHWLPDHAGLFARLAAALAPGGRLAVQMPDNFDQPSHRLSRSLAAEPRWNLGDAADRSAVATPGDYFGWLTAAGCGVDIWTTDYLQPMKGPDPVLNWLRGSLLVPVLARLTAAERTDFLAALGGRLREAYPPGADGVTLFPFRRLFILAEKPA